jgi:hypothetical protein
LLPSLYVRNFRTFRELRISRLGRVNLLAGRNNVGKTTVLEAIGAWSDGEDPLDGLTDLLRNRGELRPNVFEEDVERPWATWNFLQLFHGGDDASPMEIGPSESAPSLLNVRRAWIQTVETEENNQIVRRLEILDAPTSDSADNVPVATLVATRGGRTVPLFRLSSRRSGGLSAGATAPGETIHADRIEEDSLADIWDQVLLLEDEEAVLSAVRLISPGLQKVFFVKGLGEKRTARVRIAGLTTPAPLSSMGSGLTRFLHIASALVSVPRGYLLIDEFENGLHYQTQEPLWRMVMETAERLDVQVFATTHSWDCIAAFQAAAARSCPDACLVRLAERDGEHRATVYAGEDLAMLTAQRVEVR